MKLIIKSALVVATLLMGLDTNAQTNDKPFTFGVKAGINFSNFGGDVKNSKTQIGFNVGVTVDIALKSNFYLMSGLEFTTKGSKYKDDIYKKNTYISYLQIPVHLGYKINVVNNTKVMFHAGPYLAYGLSGKSKWTNTQTGKIEEIDLFNKYAGTDKPAMRRLDCGVGTGINVMFNNITLGVGSDFGVLNIANKFQGDENKVKVQNSYITFGYRF